MSTTRLLGLCASQPRNVEEFLVAELGYNGGSRAAALSLYFAHYNFVRIHSAIRVTPAMEAGITDHVWTLKEFLSEIGE
jgi:hypothetical protein